MEINFSTHSGPAKVNSNTPSRQSSVRRNTQTQSQPQDTINISSRSQREPENTKKADGTSASAENLKESGTSLNSFRSVERLAKYAKVVNEYYSAQNEENKKFSNPDQHIWRKYNDRNYPYYVEGLTEQERDICVRQERDVLMGKAPAINNYDPVIQQAFGGINSLETDLDYNQELRGQYNDAINQIFKENGIEIPKDADLRLTVDPYDFKIHASGADEELARKIEDALNKGQNGENLYGHIQYCNPANFGLPEPSQYSSGSDWKMSVFHVVKNLTGYDIREMENKNGRFYTPDGRDLWDVVSEKYGELREKEGAGASAFRISDTEYAVYNRLARNGWDSIPDSDLAIGYKNGSLYDVDTSYGYGEGQTKWLDDLKGQFQQERDRYQLERAETLRREEAAPNKLQQLYMRMGADENIEASNNGLGLYGVDGTFYPMRSIGEDVIARINSSFKLGIGALTDHVLKLPKATVQAAKSIDFKI